MNKSSEITQVTKIVKNILIHDALSRNSDMILYVKVCETINRSALYKPFWYVLLNLKEYNLPNFETVRRTRQKIQEQCPELSGNPEVEAQRVLNEDAFRSFARERGIV